MKYLKKFNSYLIKESQVNRAGGVFLSYVSSKSSSRNVYPTIDIEKAKQDPTLKKFTCEIGPFVLVYDGTTSRDSIGGTAYAKKGEQKSTSILKVWCQKSAYDWEVSSLTNDQKKDPENSGVKPDVVFEQLPGFMLTEKDKSRQNAEMEIAKEKAKEEIDKAGGYEEPGVTKTAYAFYKPSGNFSDKYIWAEVGPDDNLIDCFDETRIIDDFIFKIKQEIKEKLKG